MTERKRAPGGGRKPSPNPRNIYKPIKFTEDEYAAIQQAAQSANQTFSQWARQTLVEKAKERGQ